MYNYIVKFGLKTNIGVNVLHFSRPALALQPLQLKKKIHKNKIKHRQINKSFTSYYFQVAFHKLLFIRCTQVRMEHIFQIKGQMEKQQFRKLTI